MLERAASARWRLFAPTVPAYNAPPNGSGRRPWVLASAARRHAAATCGSTRWRFLCAADAVVPREAGLVIDHRSVRRAVAWRLARLQAALGLGAGVLLAPFGGWSWVVAAAVGGGAQALLSLYVAARLSAAPSEDPAAMLRGFFRAQIGKWLWAVLVFGVAARFAPQWFMPLLAGYGAGLIANWLALRWTPETGPRRRP